MSDMSSNTFIQRVVQQDDEADTSSILSSSQVFIPSKGQSQFPLSTKALLLSHTKTDSNGGGAGDAAMFEETQKIVQG